MKKKDVDLVVVGGGPVGLMCSYLGNLCDLKTLVLDKSEGPTQMGKADALNARTLQLLELAGLFKELYPLGKPCNTSSVWKNGAFVSRESSWWEKIEGCLHKHFLMLGQSYVEKCLDKKLEDLGSPVRRLAKVSSCELTETGCLTSLENGETISSSYVIGADGSHSFIRECFKIPFEITKPKLIWAVLDGVIEMDFPKVPEIIVFQNETSDVAWIPREGNLDRFYVRMDKENFSFEEALGKIKKALRPHSFKFKEVLWESKFSVKESVAENFSVENRVFLAGDACHVHSVNGGQGLNTGLGDAFNLIWKLNRVKNFSGPREFLDTYEKERKPVALSVIESSGQLVRSTKFSQKGTHAEDYVRIVEKRSGNITGMGIRYGEEGLVGSRLYDFKIKKGEEEIRLYSLLDYANYTLFVFGDSGSQPKVLQGAKIIQIHLEKTNKGYFCEKSLYRNQVILVRPDAYIAPWG